LRIVGKYKEREFTNPYWHYGNDYKLPSTRQAILKFKYKNDEAI